MPPKNQTAYVTANQAQWKNGSELACAKPSEKMDED